MGIDASIYSNVQAPQVNIPNPADYAEKSMRLSALGIQQAQIAQQLGTQAAVKTAYAKNTDPQSGQLDRAGFLSDLGKTAPMAASDYSSQFVQQDKQKAEAQTAQMQSTHQVLSVTTPALQYLLGLPDDQAAKAYPQVMAQMKSQGVPNMQNTPPEWDRGWAQQGYSVGSKMKEGLENQMIQSNIATAPIQRNADLYGSRSPNAELTSQYDKQAQPVRNSQMAMGQMIDNYKNPSPQGDASLILNAFKIKFPNAPDVNSLEELSKSQAAPDAFKQMANKAISGGLDQATRDNIMRDGVSTFRANVGSLRGIQQRYQTRAQQQNVNDPTLTMEPAIDKTYGDALALQKQIGPYVPPAQRGGMTGALSSIASKAMGIGGNQPANAASGPTPVPSGMIRVRGPDGQNRVIPVGMKGEAIAAGGTVVK